MSVINEAVQNNKQTMTSCEHARKASKAVSPAGNYACIGLRSNNPRDGQTALTHLRLMRKKD